jgi:hypothetical protein
MAYVFVAFGEALDVSDTVDAAAAALAAMLRVAVRWVSSPTTILVAVIPGLLNVTAGVP